MTVLTTDELRDMLADILAGAAGGSAERWRRAIGEVTYLPLATNVLSNWTIQPVGAAEDLETIARAVDIVREAHPYVTRG